MSITLTAFPTAFLTSPESAKNITLSKIFAKINNLKFRSPISNFSSLKNIRIITNLRMREINSLMSVFDDCTKIGENSYKLSGGMVVEWKYQDGYCNAILSGDPAYKIVPKYAEKFFAQLNKIKNFNVRDINSEEFFYYYYQTEYKNTETIINELSSIGAEIVEQNDQEIKAKYQKQNFYYFKDSKTDKFVLETEQRISLVNIGFDNSELEQVDIRTNITNEELKPLLKNFGYDFNELTSSTPLKMSANIIEWELINGNYIARIRNINTHHIKGEVEHLFLAMNKKMGRDLRLVQDKAMYTYTYKTNYTDKGVLINTLLEHGAKNLTESNNKIDCELFGMIMSYTKETENDSYNLIIKQVSDPNECKNTISDLNDEYGLNIQEITYKKILERIEAENMNLESEEVLEDNSIVLTIEI